MRNESEIISRKYEINKDIGKAVVVVSLSPSVGREPVVTIRTNDVRKWLEEQEGLKLGEAIQGGSFNNNMSRRLGNNKTVADLQMTYVFKIVQEEKPVIEVKEVKQAKPAPKKTTRRTRSTSAKSTKPAASTSKTEAKKTTTRRSRKKTTTTTSTTVKKGED